MNDVTTITTNHSTIKHVDVPIIRANIIIHREHQQLLTNNETMKKQVYFLMFEIPLKNVSTNFINPREIFKAIP